MTGLAESYSDLGRHNEALAMRESVLEFFRRVLPENHPSRGEGHVRSGDACALLNMTQLFTGTALYNLTASYEQFDALPRALDCARQALRIRRAALPPGHLDVKNAEERVCRLERATQLAASAASGEEAAARRDA